MGYGHQRAAYPLKDIAYERVINANSGKMITPSEQKQWARFRRYYEGLSRFTSVPVIGPFLFNLFDKFQSISPYYPFRDLSKPTFMSIRMHNMIRKDFLKSLIDYVKRKDLPFISTFFAPPLAAAHAGLKEVYSVITDTDINRIWVPEYPKKERIYYLTPTQHSTKRIMSYGVPAENIFFTGFPLPKENVGYNAEILKKDIGNRLPNLDPKRVYTTRYKATIKATLGKYYKTKKSHPLTLTFVVGGAGAQREIGAAIIQSLKEKILKHKIRVNLVAGTRLEVHEYFHNKVIEAGLKKELGKYVNVTAALDKKTYFERFNKLLHETDILWTKPSELSFFTALGLPIIIAPALGSQEKMNETWLFRMGTGLKQDNPLYCSEWIFEWLDRGLLAEAAWEGFTEAPRFGTYNIETVVFSKNKNKVRLRY
jgi:hypothetical protein